MSPTNTTHRTDTFGEFTLDLDRGALLRSGEDIKLRPKSFEMLSYLVERQGLLVTKDELLNAIWGHTVVTEDAITQCLGDIRRAIHDQEQRKVLTIPRRGYIFDLPVTKHGGPLAASDAPSRARPASSWPRLRPVAALVLMLGVAVVWWVLGDRSVKVTAMAAPPSIAVLPFLDMSPAQDQAYFADGISEEILNLLAQIPGLRVIARTSSFAFKGQNVDIATITEQLNVTHVLEGSVRKSSNRIRITAQLVNASTSAHIWSETYDRELENTFAVQDEISAAIVGTLEEHLRPQADAASRVIAATNTEAHDAYLRGRHLVVQRTPATILGAIREFEKAVSFDPEYALAHAELALANLLLETYTDLTITGAVVSATPHVEQAMALGPTLAETHAATGFLAWIQWNPEEALAHFERAIQINPNYAIVYFWMGNLLAIDFGRYDEAFPMGETALRLDPLSSTAIGGYIHDLDDRNRLAEADRELDKLASIDPFWAATMRGIRTARGGKWTNAILGHLDALRIDPETVVVARSELARHFAAIDLEKEALAISRQPEPGVLSWLGKSGDAVATAQAHVAEDPIDLWARHDLALALSSAGDYTRARPVLEEIWQRSGGLVTRHGMFRTDGAAALIAIRRDAIEEAGVDELVAAIRDNVRRYREAEMSEADLLRSADYEEGLVTYLAGERESGLAMIAKAVEDGFFIPQREAYLQTLYDDPGFAPIRAMQEARQARERKKFLAIVCTDNPYAAVWQPAEGTCERFATADGL